MTGQHAAYRTCVWGMQDELEGCVQNSLSQGSANRLVRFKVSLTHATAAQATTQLCLKMQFDSGVLLCARLDGSSRFCQEVLNQRIANVM